MPTDDQKRNENIPVDITKIEELFELMYLYSRLAINREISHSINNSLTALSVQHTLLMKAVHSGDQKKVTQRLKVINKVIKNLETFSSTLATTVQITPKQREVPVNRIVVDTVELARKLLSLKNCKIFLHLSEDSDSLTVDVDSIRMLFLAFLKISSFTYSTPIISITTGRHSKTGSFTIHASAKESEQAASKKLEKETLNGVGLRLGEISLTTVKRIIQSLNKNIEISLPTSEELGFTCTISSTD